MRDTRLVFICTRNVRLIHYEAGPPLRRRVFNKFSPSFHTYTIIDVGFSIFRHLPNVPDIALNGPLWAGGGGWTGGRAPLRARSLWASINLITLTSEECSTTCFGQSIIQNLQYPKLFQCRYSSLTSAFSSLPLTSSTFCFSPFLITQCIHIISYYSIPIFIDQKTYAWKNKFIYIRSRFHKSAVINRFVNQYHVDWLICLI